MSAQDVVIAMLAAAGSGDFACARSYWNDNAVWHSGGVSDSDPYAGDYGPDEYMAMAARFTQDYPDYRVEIGDLRTLGDEVLFFQLKSWASEGPYGEIDGSGALMIYRVIDGEIIEGWGIKARHDRPA